MKKKSALNVRYAAPAGEVEIRHDGGLVIFSADEKNGARKHDIVVRGGPFPLSSLFALDLYVRAGPCTVKSGSAAGKRLATGRRLRLEPGSSFTLKAKVAVVELKARPGPGLGDGNRGDDELY